MSVRYSYSLHMFKFQFHLSRFQFVWLVSGGNFLHHTLSIVCLSIYILIFFKQIGVIFLTR